ncbi:hypothetical protein G5V59_09875 [Nocardioides sp. W3-2-3]|uniref:hypothetical protein n=1 Tax=Nocardioides convexus TaxID=2712224 RepID=UPI002418940C|nr:hypothetical protein [Nocardioides convexus]NHA00309.1 hypothetical protein [Nocardioides convexus]
MMRSNGIGPRPDEAGGNAATAVPLSSLSGGRGVITSAADTDWMTVTDCSGTVTVQAEPADVGANLDVGLQVRNAAGTVLAAAAPDTYRATSGVTGLSATISMPLSGGPYHLVVSGTGSGKAWSAGGYDAYGSIGAYRVLVSGCTGNVDPSVGSPSPPPRSTPTTTTRPGAPRRPAAASGARGGRRTIVAARRPPQALGGAPVTRYLVSAYRVGARGRVVARTATAKTLGAGTHKISLALPKGRWVVRVRACNRMGWGPYSSASVRVTAR